jgi:hypothetical protein
MTGVTWINVAEDVDKSWAVFPQNAGKFWLAEELLASQEGL